MTFPCVKKLAALWVLGCAISFSALLPAAGQTVIVFGVELNGAMAVPSNNIGNVVCGRLWLNGTNLSYRFAGRAARTPVELRGPASFDTNGPLLAVLTPFGGGFDAYSECEAAAGIPAGPLQPWENPRQAIPIAEGNLAIGPNHVTELLNGQWYAHSTARAGRGHRGDPGTEILPIRGQILPLDTDGDGVPDFLDHCAGTPPGGLVNANGCTVEQLCPCDAPWKNHGDYVRCLKQALDDFVTEGLLDPGQAEALFESGAQSDCGKRKVIVAPKR